MRAGLTCLFIARQPIVSPKCHVGELTSSQSSWAGNKKTAWVGDRGPSSHYQKSTTRLFFLRLASRCWALASLVSAIIEHMFCFTKLNRGEFSLTLHVPRSNQSTHPFREGVDLQSNLICNPCFWEREQNRFVEGARLYGCL